MVAVAAVAAVVVAAVVAVAVVVVVLVVVVLVVVVVTEVGFRDGRGSWDGGVWLVGAGFEHAPASGSTRGAVSYAVRPAPGQATN